MRFRTLGIVTLLLSSGCSSAEPVDPTSGVSDVTNGKHLLTCKQQSNDGTIVVDEVPLADPKAAFDASAQKELLAKQVLDAGLPLKKYRVKGKIIDGATTHPVDEEHLGAIHTPNEHHAMATIGATTELVRSTGDRTLYRLRFASGLTAGIACEGKVPTEAERRGIDPKRGNSYAVTCFDGVTAVVANATGEKPDLSPVSYYSDTFEPVYLQLQLGAYTEAQGAGVGREGSKLSVSGRGGFMWESATFRAPTKDKTSALEGEYNRTSNLGSSTSDISCSAASID